MTSPNDNIGPIFLQSDNLQSIPVEPPISQAQLPTLSKKRSNLQVTSSKFTSKPGSLSLFNLDPAPLICDSTDVTHSSVPTEPVNETYNPGLSEHLDLCSFKTKPCPQSSQHNHKHCPFYHNAKDKKRPGFFYTADLCEFAEKDPSNCMNGDSCLKAHNRVEQLYRPEKYKTKFCTFYPANLDKCDYGSFCSFAHSECDIVIELIHNYEYDDDFYIFHFKTIWCPFNLTQHDKALCVYAHNWQDYRRKPNLHSYDPIPCPNWKSTDFILNYEDGCSYREKCNKCHGWKEHEYHPLNYKVKACSTVKTCNKGRDCPHFHTAREKRRTINPNIQSKIFRFVPKNRIVTNTFKVRADEKQIYQPQNASTNYSTNYSTSNLQNFMGTESFFDQAMNISDFMGQSTTKPQNMYCSLPDISFMGPLNPTIEQPIPQRKPSIENSFSSDDDEALRKSGISMKEIQNVANQAKIKRQWSIGPSPSNYISESDQLFREIIFSPALKNLPKEQRRASETPKESNGNGNNQLTDRILDTADL